MGYICIFNSLNIIPVSKMSVFLNVYFYTYIPLVFSAKLKWSLVKTVHFKYKS